MPTPERIANEAAGTEASPVRHNRARAKSTDESAGLRSRGEAIFQTACAKCHDPAVGRAPGRWQLASFAPLDIVHSLASGTTKPVAAGLGDTDIRAVATYLTGRQPSAVATAAADPPPCPNPGAFTMTGGSWNGWSIDPRNSRYRPDPGLTAAEIPRLKVKWAFNYPGGNYGQPAIVGGRLFLTSRGGAVYSLDARTGCLYWRFARSTPSRTTVSVAPLPGVAPGGHAAYFGDTSANVYAVAAAAGALLWKSQVDSHPRAKLTGSPVLFKDRLYVPVSSYEEGVASQAGYSCCTFRGSVVALDAATGKVIWKAFAIDRAPAPSGKNSAGAEIYGPAGAAVWSAPTIDAKRGRLYFATGNSYTDVKEEGSDAIIAVDLASGRVIWRRQVTERDNDLSGCTSRTPSRELPQDPRPRLRFRSIADSAAAVEWQGHPGGWTEIRHGLRHRSCLRCRLVAHASGRRRFPRRRPMGNGDRRTEGLRGELRCPRTAAPGSSPWTPRRARIFGIRPLPKSGAVGPARPVSTPSPPRRSQSPA